MAKKVLVVDDEEHVRQLYKEELSEEGYDVYLASGGEEAINRRTWSPWTSGCPGWTG